MKARVAILACIMVLLIGANQATAGDKKPTHVIVKMNATVSCMAGVVYDVTTPGGTESSCFAMPSSSDTQIPNIKLKWVAGRVAGSNCDGPEQEWCTGTIPLQDGASGVVCNGTIPGNSRSCGMEYSIQRTKCGDKNAWRINLTGWKAGLGIQ